MTTPRIEPLSPPYSGELAASFDRLMPPGIPPLKLFRTVAHNPRVLQRMQRGGLLDPGSISLRQREILILRTTARCGAAYEWGVHAGFFAAEAGLGEVLDDLAGADEDALEAPAERVLVATADALHERSTLSDAEFAALATHYDSAQIIEIVMLVGLYHAVSYLCRAAAVTPEDGALPLPAG